VRRNGVKGLVLSLLGLWPALSGTISVSSTGFTLTATATLTPPATYAHDLQSYSQSYVLFVTGGTGNGMAYPNFALYGVTNESPDGQGTLGSWATFGVGGLYSITAGDPYGPAEPWAPPGFGCGTHTYPSCGIPFTFNVPETVHVSASVESIIQQNPGFGDRVVGSVVFDFDSTRVTNVIGEPISGDATWMLAPVPLSDSAPEPGSWAMLLAGLAVVILVRRRSLTVAVR
jgi:hypothetical protein